MRKSPFILFMALGVILTVSCKDSEVDLTALTGKSTSYSLFTASSEWGYQGEVTFSERKDGLAVIDIQLNGPKGTAKLPAHLHFGKYSIEADMAAMLNPVDATTGDSETLLVQLATGAPITYSDLIKFDGHVKVHLGDGDNKSVILVYGNIGSNPSTVSAADVANCASW